MTALPLRSLSAALLGCAVAALAHAQPAPGAEAQAQARRDALRAQIQSERRAIDARRLQEEGACYRQFAVEDCLRGATWQVEFKPGTQASPERFETCGSHEH